MFRIGDFSQLGQISIRMLRHYDQLGLLKPSHVDEFSGYRYYSLDQLPRLNRILALKDLGLSLEQIGSLLDQDLSAEQLRGMLIIKQAELEQEVSEAQRRLAHVHARLHQIELEDAPPVYEVVMKEMTRTPIASMRMIVPQIDDMKDYRCNGFDALYGFLNRQAIKPTTHELVMYHMREYSDVNIDMELAVPVEEEVIDELGHGRDTIQFRWLEPDASAYATTIHSGHIGEIASAILALWRWAGDNDYTIGGPLREVHLSESEADHHMNIEAVVFEFQLPVLRR